MLQKLLSSRTVWTVAVLFLVGGVEAIGQFIPDSIETTLLGGLALLATYFKLNPSQDY